MTSRAKGPCCIVRGVPRMCMRIKGARACRATSARRGSVRNAETSFTISAPASSAASATSALRVSTDIGMRSLPRNSWITGRIRRSSSSEETEAAPGRVDSPPTSRMSAPSRSSCNARAMAASESRYSPPSEKLSGVIFNTPMIRVRSPRISVRERRRSRNRLRRNISATSYKKFWCLVARASACGVWALQRLNPAG